MKTIFFTSLMILFSNLIFGQIASNIDVNQINASSQFVVDKIVKIQETNKNGNLFGEVITMPANAIFSVVGESNDSFIIQFLNWKFNKKNISNNMNFYFKGVNTIEKNSVSKSNLFEKTTIDLNTGKVDRTNNGFNKSHEERVSIKPNVIEVENRYFLIKKTDLVEKATVYKPVPKIEFVFGTVSYIARIRPSIKDVPSKWTTDLNLGIAYGVKRNFNKNHAICLMGGFSISKISIDSLSTKPSISKSIEKVSLSPTLNLLYSYRNFFVGGAIGFDWINIDGEESMNWIYNKKPFFAFGLGVNIFSNTGNASDNGTNRDTKF